MRECTPKSLKVVLFTVIDSKWKFVEARSMVSKNSSFQRDSMQF